MEKTIEKKIRKILEELIYRQYVNKCESKYQVEEDRKNEKLFDQALTAIEQVLKVNTRKVNKIVHDLMILSYSIENGNNCCERAELIATRNANGNIYED